MVDAVADFVGPPSRYTFTDSPSCSIASSTVVAGGCPVRLALVTAIGPVSSSSARATRYSGIRTATVPFVSPRSQSSAGGAWHTRVSGPGQKADTSSRAEWFSPVAIPSSVRGFGTSTGGGTLRPRPLAASTAATAAGSKASAPTPYTVSVGSTTTSPRWTAFAAIRAPVSRPLSVRQSMRFTPGILPPLPRAAPRRPHLARIPPATQPPGHPAPRYLDKCGFGPPIHRRYLD